MRILGTSITCYGDLDIVRREDIDQQLFVHLRLSNIEHRCEDDLLHSVPLDQLLRPDHREPVWPGTPGGRHKSHPRPLEGGCVQNVAVQCISRSPSPGPGHPRSPWGGMVLRLGKGHCDAQAFVAQELSEPSLPPSNGSCCAANICHDASSSKLFRKVTRTREFALMMLLLLLLLFLLWWLWCGREIDNDVSVDIESKKTAVDVQLDGVRKMPQFTAKPPSPPP